MSVGDALLAVAIGLGSGVLSGLFGVGGGIVMTPAVDAFLPVPEIVALETPLPVIFPTAIAGAYTYWKAGEVDRRAATLMAPLGLVGAVVGAGVYLGIGLVAGLVSGLLGIGGGLVIVPLLAGWLGMPLKRALGTSLLTIPALVIPGTIVHAILGNIDWALFVFLAIGAVPGARVGARLALGTAETKLRAWVGTFMLLVACAYGLAQAVALIRGS